MNETVQIHSNGNAVRITDTIVAFQYPQKNCSMYEVQHSIDEPWIQNYRYCAMCNKPLDASDFAYALVKLEKRCCSIECLKAEQIKRWACCDKAVMTPCVCTYSFSCPEHGEKHIGTHD